MKKLLLILAMTGALIIPALASANPSRPTLAVTPIAPVVGDSLVFTGCGWAQPSKNNPQVVSIIIDFYPAGGFQQFGAGVQADANGCISTAGVLALTAASGAYQVMAFQGNGYKGGQAFLTVDVP